MMNHQRYILRETLVSVVINVVLTVMFFIAVFGVGRSVAVWGLGAWVFDFVPQSFMIALMSTLVPGVLTARKIASGTLAPSGGRSPLPRRLLPRAALLAVASALLGTALMALLAQIARIETLGFVPALSIKMAYAVTLAVIVTPIGLRAALVNPA
jgi:hypothetical protein